jgi:hypothetical protein
MFASAAVTKSSLAWILTNSRPLLITTALIPLNGCYLYWESAMRRPNDDIGNGSGPETHQTCIVTCWLQQKNWPGKRRHQTLSETTHYLHANINQWRLGCDCPRPSEGADQPTWMLRLAGITSSPFADFANLLPIELTLLDHEVQADDEDIFHPWQLSLIDDMGHYDIPTLLEGLLTLSKATWSALKETLFLAAGNPRCAVRVRLETRELQNSPGIDRPARNFDVISLGFDLCSQKKSQ